MKLTDLRKYNLDLILPVSLVILAELLIFFDQLKAGIIVHALNLTLLILSSIYVENRLYSALMLLPLFRLLNVAMPVFFKLTLYSYPLTYAPMFLPILLIMKEGILNRSEAGITLRGFWLYLPLAMAAGLALGWGEYQVLHPGMIIPSPNLENLLVLSLIMILFVGVVEEFVFRSALQTMMEERLGAAAGILSTSLLFGFMHSGYHLPLEVIFVSLAGVVFGLLFWATRSLPIVALAHGVTNVSLFAVVPNYPTATFYLLGISALWFLAVAFLSRKIDKKSLKQYQEKLQAKE